MNKTDRIILSTAALLAITFTVSAQDSGTKEPGPYSIAKQITDPKNGNKPPVFPEETYKPVDVDDDNKIAFTKNISMPFKDGTYWIKLESFATGEASYKMSAEPADIVLVLDFSQSMTNQYSTTLTYVPYVNNTYQQINQTGRYVYYEGAYRRLSVRRLQRNGTNVSFNQGGYAWAYFQIESTVYYLDGYGDNTIIRVASDPVNMSDHPVWTGSGNFGNNTIMTPDVLYASDNNVSRLEALKVAVNSFIDVIYHNDNYDENEELRAEPLGNRISIVMFSTVNDTRIVGNGWTEVSTSSREKNTELLNTFIAVTNTPRQTHSDEGMSKAISLLKQIKDGDPDRMIEASRTVVLFTDGAPGEMPNWTDPVSTNVANNAIANSKAVKTEYDATVFSVLVGNASGDMVTYMNAVTSNYPLATSLTDLGPICTSTDLDEKYRKEKADFYKNAGSDLSGVFEDIAQQSGGDSNTSLTAATSTVDIVSDNFVFPEGIFEEGADINDYVKVFTAKLEKIENGEYVFLEEVMAPYSTDTYDEYEKGVLKREDVDIDGTTDEPTISVVLDGGKTIKVTGFDYANNWCGPVKDEDGQTIDYQGHKMIIMIPIKMNPDAVGGPDVTTNIVGSGIIVPGQTEPIVSFESPTVSLPINLHIEKIGLNPGESAKFRIERAEIPLEGSWSLEEITDWHYVTSIFVTQPQGADPSNKPMVKVRGMASVGKNSDNEEVGYVYKITEEDWSWSYERDATPQYTVTTKVTNPFSFSNTKKKELEYKLRHAESKATNIFKMEGGVIRYDNSK